MDMTVAGEMQDQISEASERAQGKGKGGSADARSKWQRRKQKRAKRESNR
jgi:hypothetical protein